MLEVRRLRLLRELSGRGTIAEVADALHLSPSSVSQQLSQLEREVGVPLLRKVGRRLELTPSAEVLVEHTERILSELEEAESAAVGVSGEASGTVRIAVFQSAAVAFMPRLLAELAEAHPRLRVTMSQREPEEGMRETAAHEFDLVIAEQYPHHAAPRYPSLDRVPLTADTLHLAVPLTGERFAAVHSIAQAWDLPWVMEPGGAASRHWAEQLCRQAGFEPDIRFETDDLQAHLALIESGNAVAVLPDLMLVPRRPAARLIDLPGDPKRSVFTCVRTSSARTPAVVACRAVLAEVFPEAVRLE
ncbi:LysR family transcriptional regulator [Flexivirga caeni]|uniref:LysR family transcriptional regulator n=1 Tax=Flexivirga caeni TaxID=2294115 RepID=A0A3M9MJM5_9MICO|nr:LysR substrate-binding domain-containing protein [Flexivirga caeni]RNI25385.1 LysR family transcriptional regulator [Flexivirga caeni]